MREVSLEERLIAQAPRPKTTPGSFDSGVFSLFLAGICGRYMLIGMMIPLLLGGVGNSEVCGASL
ncbi:MAG: hypothetical protein ACOZEN_00485 [Thermodesulfobacteriota bacterium]